jgi:hypothetical protein
LKPQTDAEAVETEAEAAASAMTEKKHQQKKKKKKKKGLIVIPIRLPDHRRQGNCLLIRIRPRLLSLNSGFI